MSLHSKRLCIVPSQRSVRPWESTWNRTLNICNIHWIKVVISAIVYVWTFILLQTEWQVAQLLGEVATIGIWTNDIVSIRSWCFPNIHKTEVPLIVRFRLFSVAVLSNWLLSLIEIGLLFGKRKNYHPRELMALDIR